MNQIPPLTAASNAANLDAALQVLKRLVHARLSGGEIAPDGQLQLRYFDDGSALGEFIGERRPPFDEYVLLLLALAPHVRPTLLDTEIRTALARDGDFPEIGGVRDADSRTFLPTGETAAFLLAGDDLESRFAVQRLFSPDHWFACERMLRLEPPKDGAPLLSGRIVMARDWIERFTLGAVQAPAFGADFPARRITTELEWSDLVLTEQAREQIVELEDWVRHGRRLSEEWGMGKRLRPGYRALFHGPSGTGKTLTATLLGKATGRDVYRVDLSTVVSKYIGETEKNLSALFDRAEQRDWILFFDEADALFGKRTGVKDAHDRYANQEVSYLLQRVEDFDGLVILASNFRSNMDDAFLRRFSAIIRFPMPSIEERRAIWVRTLPDRCDREALAASLAPFELSGGNIVNIVRHAAIAAMAAGRDSISLDDALKGIRREVEKEGRVFHDLLAEGEE
jgi:AAA+ superfamily predicted ATPase